MSSDLQIAIDPERTYRRLLAEHGRRPWLHVLSRLLLLVLTLAVVVPIVATHTITIGLVLISAAVWCFVPATQMAMALLTIAPARGRTARLGRALDLWFAGHVPYTAWLVLLPIITRLGQAAHFDFVVITFAAAVVWSSFIETAYCRVVLNTSPSTSRTHVAVHQALMLTIVLGGGLWASSLSGFASFLAQTMAHLRVWQ